MFSLDVDHRRYPAAAWTFYSDADALAALDGDAAIASQRLAFESLGRGEARRAAKTAIRTGDNTVLSYRD
ncbi:hypothetical protein GCM10009854_30260 [Saccharopolyspora halophila]|uniref:Uncharacterized protein n=1 Tax=Saccharopolyspora halophila TaxID=405551 RepID=A0ABP5TDW5_9PSEU